MTDLFSDLRHAYNLARANDDVASMDTASHALALASSGNRDMAIELAKESGLFARMDGLSMYLEA